MLYDVEPGHQCGSQHRLCLLVRKETRSGAATFAPPPSSETKDDTKSKDRSGQEKEEINKIHSWDAHVKASPHYSGKIRLILTLCKISLLMCAIVSYPHRNFHTDFSPG